MLLVLNFIIPVFLVILWSIASAKTNRLAYRPTYGHLRSKARGLLILVAISQFLILAKIIITVILGMKSWWFIQDTVLLQLPYIIFPAIAVCLFSIPELWSITRKPITDAKEYLTDADRFLAAAPRLVIPVQLTLLGTVIDELLTLFMPAAPIHVSIFIIVLVVFTLMSAALWIMRQSRLKIMTMNQRFIIPSLKIRFFRKLLIYSIIIVSAASIYLLSQNRSILPDHLSMMAGEMDYGGGQVLMEHTKDSMTGEMNAMHIADIEPVSLTTLVEPSTAEADRKITLTAEKKTVTLSSGEKIEAWTFNGILPGPELHLREGELVEITLLNKDIEEGVTLHWHGLDVPNAEDGVSGLTQNAVMPGQKHVYRFRPHQVGTFWYHSHQDSAEQVKKGLYGALIVEAKGKANNSGTDITAMAQSLDSQNSLDRRTVQPHTPVKMRLINTENSPSTFSLTGVKFKVTAIDGVDLNQPTDIESNLLVVAGGGRYDISFIMPDTPVYLSKPKAGILLSSDGQGDIPPLIDGPIFDPASYGSPKSIPFNLSSHFDRNFLMVLDNKLGFYDGSELQSVYTINGRTFPDTPMFMVKEGDLVKTTFVNRSMMPHPMHLHGHHMLVLSRNGTPITGSPWWTDSLNVNPGDTYEVGFVANNPGIWMDHCHNLDHAAVGMSMHLAYIGVTTPFEVGHATHNKPE